jgi:ribosomal protein S12 methylthiotransferase accessory factor
MSRALSVHQGKGASDADAKVGALLEAVESHAAEMFEAEGPVCPFVALPKGARALTIADFAADRERPPAADELRRWVEAEDLLGGGSLYLPLDFVSLDFTRGVPSLFDRASNGVATAASREEAVATALHEYIERDAVTEWQAKGLLACMETTLDPDTVHFPWFRLWHERIAAAGATMRCYHVPSVTGTPVFACEINDTGKDGTPYRAIQGRGCHPLPEIALFKAVAEALQGRATYIAGARDDLLPSDYAPPASPAITIAFGMPLPPSMDGLEFARVEPGSLGVDALALALEQAGYGRIAVVELARPQGLCVVRAFVCGLGSLLRRRRPPLP